MEPGLVMAYGIGIPEYDAHPLLIEAGIPVALNGDFVEQDPLGRTEWMKFIAFFFNKEGEADRLFNEVVDSYNATAALAAGVTARPTVFLSSIYDGTWWMPGGDSYTARLLVDAGADYLWADSAEVGSSPVDFETGSIRTTPSGTARPMCCKATSATLSLPRSPMAISTTTMPWSTPTAATPSTNPARPTRRWC
jgi:ABC-type Fe3+-hydroxamate transport system substrate-binding protein